MPIVDSAQNAQCLHRFSAVCVRKSLCKEEHPNIRCKKVNQLHRNRATLQQQMVRPEFVSDRFETLVNLFDFR
jgi:hypothetical protein